MILQTVELSPSQRAAIEEKVGRKLHEQENIVLCGGTAKVASAEARENAAQQMRHRLVLLDPSERRMSIEECASALLDKLEMTA